MDVRVVVLGGSGVATPELARGIHGDSSRSASIELVLVGRDRLKLAKVAEVSRRLADADPLLRIAASTDAASALEGADYVVNQVRVGGLEARAFDESFPRELGMPGEETVGPGGFANASRTIPVVLEYARLVERVCPKARVLTFANPSSLVQYAISRYTSLFAVGLCDSPIVLIRSIAAAIGAPADELVVDYVGMHHFGWVTGVSWRGRDVLGLALERAERIVGDLEPEIARAMGAIPGPYLRYIVHPGRMLAKTRGRRTRAEELIDLQAEILADYDRVIADNAEPTALARRNAVWYGMILVPLLISLIEGRHSGGSPRLRRYILNVTNGQTIPWLPPDAIVEVPTLVDGGRIRPLAVGPVPPDVRALIQANCAYEMLAVESIVERDRGKALRALLLNPMIRTHDRAIATLDRAWA